MNWFLIFDWTVVIIILIMGVMSTWAWRRTLRNVDRLKLLFAEEAPPVGDVQVHLKTGEVVTVKPIEPHRAYIWMVPMPCSPMEVDEIVMPEIPPWTEIVPVPSRHAPNGDITK